ncbi:conserved hypothetical protein [Vibrio phage 137E35-1]|nr:conserved hypothetical protein [Vibrio phage 137E35-1]CAH9015566.1 conserved hypothetical protein [Vibrio phage 230E39-1]
MGSHSQESNERGSMIDFEKVLIALNVKGNEIATGLGIDVCFDGITLAGEIYEPEPQANYINFVLVPNDVDRRGLANGEAEVMQAAIYQATIHVGKDGKANPNMEALKLSNSVRGGFSQGLKLVSGGQTCKVTRADRPVSVPNETHKAYAVGIYFDCIA